MKATNKAGRLSIAVLAVFMAMVMLLATSCGQKPEPDTSNPVQSGDVSTDISSDATGDAAGDGTDDTTTGTDEVSGDSTDEVSGDTAADVSGDATGSTTGNKTSGNQTTGKTSGNQTSGKTSSTTKKPGGGGILNTTASTTSKTQKTSATTTKKEVDETVKGKILSMFTPAMKGKTATILIHFDHPNDTGQLMQMQEETGVKVKFQICDLEDYGTRLSALINASAAPDVCYMAGSHYPSLVIKGFVQDLSATKQDLTMDIFDTQLMENYVWNNKKYAVMLKNSGDAHFSVTYYNKTIFKRLGVTDPGTLWNQGKWNWDTFRECAKAVNDPNNGVWGCELYASHTFLITSGKGLITVGNGEIINNLDSQEIIDAWNFVNELHHVDKVTTGLAGAETNFSTGKSVMMVGENWMTGYDDPVGQTKDDWGMVPAPCKPGVEPFAVATPRAACIPVGSRNPDLGLAAYMYWSSNDVFVDDDDVEPEDRPANYPEEELLAMRETLWNMPKVINCSQGVIEYGGEYSQWDFSFDVFQAGMSGISTNISKWKTAIDVNIKRIMTEFS